MTQPVAIYAVGHGERGNLTCWSAQKRHAVSPFLCRSPRCARILRCGLSEILVGGAGFEPATPWMSTKYSNQLN